MEESWGLRCEARCFNQSNRLDYCERDLRHGTDTMQMVGFRILKQEVFVSICNYSTLSVSRGDKLMAYGNKRRHTIYMHQDKRYTASARLVAPG